MPAKPAPFTLFFERLFLESYLALGLKEKEAIDRSVQLLASNPRHPSLQVHKAKSIQAKYPVGGTSSHKSQDFIGNFFGSNRFKSTHP
jgi:hypothetical protein